jgi:hypothetical protein
VFVVCLASGVCDGLITRSEESFRLCVCVCVSVCLTVCDQKTLKHEATRAGVELLGRENSSMKSDNDG